MSQEVEREEDLELAHADRMIRRGYVQCEKCGAWLDREDAHAYGCDCEEDE
tara:strand:- start:895 stop:1047 length:153 start_codon:yes stop_codon:yes gene_type:complete